MCFNVGPQSATLAQHWSNIGFYSRVQRDALLMLCQHWKSVEGDAANTRRETNVGSMLAHRLRRWPIITQYWVNVSCVRLEFHVWFPNVGPALKTLFIVTVACHDGWWPWYRGRPGYVPAGGGGGGGESEGDRRLPGDANVTHLNSKCVKMIQM